MGYYVGLIMCIILTAIMIWVGIKEILCSVGVCPGHRLWYGIVMCVISLIATVTIVFGFINADEWRYKPDSTCNCNCVNCQQCIEVD